MERNLDRRIEAVAPVDRCRQLRIACATIMDVMLADDRRAWSLDSDDIWRRVEQIVDHPTVSIPSKR